MYNYSHNCISIFRTVYCWLYMYVQNQNCKGVFYCSDYHVGFSFFVWLVFSQSICLKPHVSNIFVKNLITHIDVTTVYLLKYFWMIVKRIILKTVCFFNDWNQMKCKGGNINYTNHRWSTYVIDFIVCHIQYNLLQFFESNYV